MHEANKTVPTAVSSFAKSIPGMISVSQDAKVGKPASVNRSMSELIKICTKEEASLAAGFTDPAAAPSPFHI